MMCEYFIKLANYYNAIRLRSAQQEKEHNHVFQLNVSRIPSDTDNGRARNVSARN